LALEEVTDCHAGLTTADDGNLEVLRAVTRALESELTDAPTEASFRVFPPT
jgi:hypothetical protein